jgi:hypothetical protein
MADYPRPGGQFSLETCRLMLAMLDADHTGTMGFSEFKQLWDALSAWKVSFQKYEDFFPSSGWLAPTRA